MTENFDEVKEELIKKGYEVNVQNKNITIERENKKSILKTLNKEWNNEYILGKEDNDDEYDRGIQSPDRQACKNAAHFR